MTCLGVFLTLSLACALSERQRVVLTLRLSRRCLMFMSTWNVVAAGCGRFLRAARAEVSADVLVVPGDTSVVQRRPALYSDVRGSYMPRSYWRTTTATGTSTKSSSTITIRRYSYGPRSQSVNNMKICWLIIVIYGLHLDILLSLYFSNKWTHLTVK